MSTKLETYIFTYGTLKRNFPNHHFLTNERNAAQVQDKECEIPKSEFVSSAKTKDAFPLIVSSSCTIPFMLDAVGIGKNICGEVYLVNDAMLSLLDTLESHPTAYVRRVIDIVLDDSEEIKGCWTYLFPDFKPSLLELPQIDDYTSSYQYVPKHLRKEGTDTYQDIRK